MHGWKLARLAIASWTGAVLLFNSACFWWAARDLPAIGVDVQGTGSRPAFTFKLCPDPNHAPALLSLTVFRVQGGTREVMCDLILRDAGVERIGRSWMYPSNPTGYERKGTCGPLQPGVKYEINVSGPGPGVRVFQVAANGNLVAATRPCE
jgi:hypothetical protein